MAKRPKPNVDVAISELKTAIENDVNKFLEKAKNYALKGKSTQCLADILVDFNDAVDAVTTVLENKTPRGDAQENTEKVSAASAAAPASSKDASAPVSGALIAGEATGLVSVKNLGECLLLK